MYIFGFRSSHRSCSVKKDVLKNFSGLTWKHLCWSLFLIHTCIPVTFMKFLRTSSLKSICEQLLLRKYWLQTIVSLPQFFFLFRFKVKRLKNVGAKVSFSLVFPSELPLFSLKCKCYIVFSVFLSLDQT